MCIFHSDRFQPSLTHCTAVMCLLLGDTHNIITLTSSWVLVHIAKEHMYLQSQALTLNNSQIEQWTECSLAPQMHY